MRYSKLYTHYGLHSLREENTLAYNSFINTSINLGLKSQLGVVFSDCGGLCIVEKLLNESLASTITKMQIH